MCGKFHVGIQFFVHSKSLLFVLITDDDRFINYMNYSWLKDSPKIDLHKASNCPNYGLFA